MNTVKTLIYHKNSKLLREKTMTEKVEMTPERIKACYDLGKQVYEEDISRIDAIAKLIDVYGMNENSSHSYISVFRNVIRGGEFNWSVNQGYLRYFFGHASKEEIKIALAGLEKHIEYYSKKAKPSNVPGLRKLYNECSEQVGFSKRL